MNRLFQPRAVSASAAPARPPAARLADTGVRAPVARAPATPAPTADAPDANAAIARAPSHRAPADRAPTGRAPTGHAPTGHAPTGHAGGPAGTSAPPACASIACAPVHRALTADARGAHAGSVALAPGRLLLQAGQRGPLWRITEGWLALTLPGADADALLQLAGPGDWVGLAALADAPYGESALALTAVRAEPVPWADADAPRALLQAALRQQQRQALDMSRLRTGAVRARLQHLLALLTPPGGVLPRQALPPLKMLARIVDSADETVCRGLRGLLPARPGRDPHSRRAAAPRGSPSAPPRASPLAALAA